MPAALQPRTKLGAAIRDARKRAGYARQGELAQALRVTQATVSSWEVGVTRPDADLMLLLHDEIGVPLDAYFADLDAESIRTGIIDALLDVMATAA